MIENVVGETGFEPATLCSQSSKETRKINSKRVNAREIDANRINDLPEGCKPKTPPPTSCHDPRQSRPTVVGIHPEARHG